MIFPIFSADLSPLHTQLSSHRSHWQIQCIRSFSLLCCFILANQSIIFAVALYIRKAQFDDIHMCTIDRASFWLYFQNFEKKDVISYQTCKTLFNFKVATMNLKHSVDPSLFFENADIISQLEMFCSDRFT